MQGSTSKAVDTDSDCELHISNEPSLEKQSDDEKKPP